MNKLLLITLLLCIVFAVFAQEDKCAKCKGVCEKIPNDKVREKCESFCDRFVCEDNLFFEDGKCVKVVKALRKKFRESENKKAFVKKVAEKLLEKHPDVPKGKVIFFLRTLFFRRMQAKRVCKLYKKIFGGDKQEEEILSEVNEDIENIWKKAKCVVKCLKGKVKIDLKKAIKLILKCRDNVKCYVKELNLDEKALECVMQCVSFADMKKEGKCLKKVKESREHFRSLKSREEKKEYVKKVANYLKEKHPEAKDKLVQRFVGILFFTRTPAPRVCKLYKKWFVDNKGDDEEEFDLMNIWKKAKCIVKCVKGSVKIDLKKAIKLVMKCKKDVKCYVKELNLDKKATECVMKCI